MDLTNLSDEELKQELYNNNRVLGDRLQNAERRLSNARSDYDYTLANISTDWKRNFEEINIEIERRQHPTCIARQHNSWSI